MEENIMSIMSRVELNETAKKLQEKHAFKDGDRVLSANAEIFHANIGREFATFADFLKIPRTDDEVASAKKPVNTAIALYNDEQRMTRYGEILRSTSLDELPELLNILKGDMALVGPRPQLVRDMVFMTPNQRRRHSIRPGLTGLAQVSGRNNITWEQKLQYDLDYLDSGITLFGDLKIIFMTAFKVFKREDVVRDGTVSDMDFGDWLLRNGDVTKEDYDRLQAEAKKLLKA